MSGRSALTPSRRQRARIQKQLPDSITSGYVLTDRGRRHGWLQIRAMDRGTQKMSRPEPWFVTTSSSGCGFTADLVVGRIGGLHRGGRQWMHPGYSRTNQPSLACGPAYYR